MEKTSSSLLKTWDAITRPKPLRARTLGLVQATHLSRARDTFEDPNIVAIGISEKITDKKETGKLSLCFYVEKKLSKRKVSPKHAVPPVMASPDGAAVFTDVKEIGRPRLDANARKKPIKSGFSVGHIDSQGGTLGAIVKKGGNYYILSNAHVLALEGKAKIGDKVVFPGVYDKGALPNDLVATLSSFVPIVPGGNLVNRVDAALAQIDAGRVSDIDFEIFGAGQTLDTVEPQVGMIVRKRGRTSGETESIIRDAHFSPLIPYDMGDVGFIEQILCDRYTSQGDSGAIVVEKKSGKVVGLHFASHQKGSVCNPIGAVIKALGFTFTRA